MRQFILAIVFGAGLAWPGSAQDVLLPEPGIEATIQSQIDAFLLDDFATAFTFASPSIRSIFRTPENFGAMVRQGYPMVWRPDDVRFGDLRNIDGDLWQQVIIRDKSGAQHVLDYRMEQGPDGEWRISGVQLLPTPDVSA